MAAMRRPAFSTFTRHTAASATPTASLVRNSGESYAAALGAVIPVALMVLRLLGEERFLCRALPEYRAYM